MVVAFASADLCADVVFSQNLHDALGTALEQKKPRAYNRSMPQVNCEVCEVCEVCGVYSSIIC